MIAFLLANWKAIAVALLLAAVFETGHHLGASSVQDAWDKEKVKQQAQVIGAENSVIIKERADNKATNEVSHDYQTHISAIDAQYAAALNGVSGSGSAASPSGVPAVSSGQPGHNEATCTAGLPEGGKRARLLLMQQADQQTARLMACQAWIRVHSPGK